MKSSRVKRQNVVHITMEEPNFQSNGGIIYFVLLCFVSFFEECIMICCDMFAPK